MKLAATALLRMIRKDLLRKLRSPLGILVMLLFPVFFAGIMALAFGGGGSVPRVHLLVEDRDGNLLGGFLKSALGSDQAAEFLDVEMVGEDGLQRIEKGQGSALLRIPENFTSDFLEGEPTTLELYRNPAQGIMPEVAEQLAGILSEMLSAASRVLRDPLDHIVPFASSEDLVLTDQAVAEAAVAAKGVFDGAGRFLSPVVIDLETVTLDENGEESGEDDGSPSQAFSIFLFVFPGVSVWSLFVIGDACMRDLLTELDAGTLRRQLYAPIGTNTLVLAKAGFTAVLSLLALAILTIIGWFAADRPVDPAGYSLLSFALILAVTGAAATVYGATGSQTRGAAVSSLIYLALAFAGGSFIPLDSLPGVMRALAPVSPFYWGTRGYQTLLQQGGVADILTSVVVLTGLGAVLLALGAWLLQRHVARGTA